jgi:two-component system cell cycle sensor histidine kinase/response regulator CckA
LGAQDYLVKDQISPEMMSKSIRYAIERKLIEHELQQAQQLARLGRLAGGIGHHFNNLLAIIGSYAAFLAESLAGAPPGQADHWQEARDDVHNIRQAAQRATELTRQLLTFAEQDIANPQLIKLNEIIEDEADLLAARLGDGIKLDMSLAPDVCPILVDRGHIQQLLACLANNARDAMPGGGRMLISTARGQDLEGTGGPPTRSYARSMTPGRGSAVTSSIMCLTHFLPPGQ